MGLIIPPGIYDYGGLFLDHLPGAASSSILSRMADLPQVLLAISSRSSPRLLAND